MTTWQLTALLMAAEVVGGVLTFCVLMAFGGVSPIERLNRWAWMLLASGALSYRRLSCSHQFVFQENIHGDNVIRADYNRSVWVCSKCGQVQLRKSLNEVAQ